MFDLLYTLRSSENSEGEGDERQHTNHRDAVVDDHRGQHESGHNVFSELFDLAHFLPFHLVASHVPPETFDLGVDPNLGAVLFLMADTFDIDRARRPADRVGLTDFRDFTVSLVDGDGSQ